MTTTSCKADITLRPRALTLECPTPCVQPVYAAYVCHSGFLRKIKAMLSGFGKADFPLRPWLRGCGAALSGQSPFLAQGSSSIG